MRGRVLELTENQIYLQVGDQLRFRSSYVCASNSRLLQSGEQVDFEFAPIRDRLCVLIQATTAHSGRVTRGRSALLTDR